MPVAGFWRRLLAFLGANRRTWLPPLVLAIALCAVMILLDRGQNVTAALYRIF
jgi:hypothetical protein